jgi:RND family efflux transporter MFP subunit
MIARATAALLAAAITLAAPQPANAQPGGNGPPPAQVITDPARLQQVEIRREVIGEVRAPSLSRTAAQEPGRVDAVLIDPGDPVSAGQPIVRLDTTLLELELKRARAEADALEATLAERQATAGFLARDLRRVRELNERGSATQRELDRAETDAAAADARVRQTSADLQRASAEIARIEERIDDMTVRAPFDGGVIRKHAEVGEWVSPGTIVAELARLDEVDVYVDVPESFVAALSEPDATADITITALGRTVRSSELSLIDQGDQLARTFPLRVRLDNTDRRMKPAMSVTASVPTGASGERLTISKDAVLRNDAGPFVFINRNGGAAAVPVTILFATGERFAIRTDAFPAGTGVVVIGNERLQPGQPLQSVEGEIPPQAAGVEAEAGSQTESQASTTDDGRTDAPRATPDGSTDERPNDGQQDTP